MNCCRVAMTGQGTCGLTGSLSLLSKHWKYSRLPVSVGSGDLDFGRDVYAARALLTKPSPQLSLADNKFHKDTSRCNFYICSVPVHKSSLISSAMTTANESRATCIWWHKPVIPAPGRQGQEELSKVS